MNTNLGSLFALAVGLSGVFPTMADTVAYWRFESGPANAVVSHGGATGAFNGTTPDVSGNGNDLSATTQGGTSGYAYRSDVPNARVPQLDALNRFSVRNTGPAPALFTSAAGGLPTGIDARTFTPARFTIEASYKPEITGSFRTLVGRDARNVSTADGNLAALYLQIRPDDSFAITFTDVTGHTHTANSAPGWAYGFVFGSNPEGVGTPWYHLAATSDGSTLRLYVDNVLVGSTDLTQSGSTNRALAKGSAGGNGWTTGAWSVGRGLYAGAPVDRAYGFVDEVRISDAALAPRDFLFAPRAFLEKPVANGSQWTFQASGGQPGSTGQILRSVDAGLPLAQWAVIGAKAFDAGGNFSFATTFDAANASQFFVVKAPFSTTPPVRPLTYSLAGGSETWPADVRSRILYAMDGAVAEYNRYGTFKKHITVAYNPGVPTAQSNYEGYIEFGANASYQQFRTALHETAHALGVGTTWQWGAHLSNGSNGTWTGARGIAQIHAFDGPNAQVYSDGTHFWGINGGGSYGLNYDNEGNTESFRRHVMMVAAFRKDMGVE